MNKNQDLAYTAMAEKSLWRMIRIVPKLYNSLTAVLFSQNTLENQKYQIWTN